MGTALRSKVAEIRAMIAAGNTPQQPSQGEQSASAAPDPCQPELNTIGSLMDELATFLDSWEPRFADAEEALECCRIANPGSEPE